MKGQKKRRIVRPLVCAAVVAALVLAGCSNLVIDLLDKPQVTATPKERTIPWDSHEHGKEVAEKTIPQGEKVPGSLIFNGEQEITITKFWMSDHETTQADFAEYCTDYYEPTRLDDDGNPANPSEQYGKGDKYPAYYVSWYDALVYCNLRSIDEQLTPCYSIMVDGSPKTDPVKWGTVPTQNNKEWNAAVCNSDADGYRLPTSYEWEYAARGGDMASQYAYSGSNDIGAVAWYAGNSGGKTHEVGLLKANALGLYDMSGNLSELTFDDSPVWYPANQDQKPRCGGNFHVTEDNILKLYGDALFADYDTQAELFSAIISVQGAAHKVPIILPYQRQYDTGFRVCRTITETVTE